MSSTKRVQRMSIYAGNELVGEVSTGKYTHASNDDQGHGFDGAIYFSDGNDTTESTFDTIVPKAGHKANLKAIVLGHKDVTLTWFVDGGFEKADGRIVERSYDSDSKSGMLKGSFKFMGGAPSIL